MTDTQAAQTPEDEYAAAFAEAAAERTGDVKAEEPKAEEPQADAAQEAAPSDPASELEELKRKLAEAEHRERSASARVSAFHRKANAAEARIRELESKVQQVAAPKQEAATGELDEEALSELPEVAKLVDRLVDRKVRESVKQVEQTVEPLRRRAEQDELRAQLAVVEQEYPNWRETVFSDEFRQWIDAKPQALRTAYAHANTPDDAIEFLRMYERESQPARTVPPSPKEKLTKAVGVPARGTAAPMNGGLPAEDDYSSAFEHFARLRKKQA